tara:strand:+ start:42 stop:368 length:327 start_codon:yes stop_codon:yes gene_type:complete
MNVLTNKRKIKEEMNSQKDWSTMTDKELSIAAFGEGIPPGSSKEEEECKTIIIYMDSDETQMPFGIVKAEPFLELFWRKTGADCDGEEGEMELPDGNTYMIQLVEHSE